MIDPTTITNYNRTQAELEEFLLFSIMVASKKSTTTAKKLDAFLKESKHWGVGDFSPLQYIAFLQGGDGLLMSSLKKHKVGQYERIRAAFAGVLQFYTKLNTVSVEELESVKGIGPKTARFFVAHSQKDAQLAVLDTHVLHYLRDLGINAPTSTPNGKKYQYLEKLFLEIAKLKNMIPADLDLQIWKMYSKTQPIVA
jgi:hypothetical protein